MDYYYSEISSISSDLIETLISTLSKKGFVGTLFGSIGLPS